MKNVLITGCRSGFGMLTAVAAARAGHRVFAGLRELSSGDTLARASEGLPVHPLQLDVTSPEQREAAVSRIEADWGGVDALVNNAGIALGGPLEELDEDELRRQFEVNVFAVWALTNRVLPHMRDKAGGCVVNVSSMAGRTALPFLGAYAASKHALSGMTEALRHEVGPFGIRVVLIEPGPYKTDIFERNRRVARRARGLEGPYAELKAMVERAAARVDAQSGDAQEVADRIVRVLADSQPAPRYPMGPNTRLRRLARALLPDRLYDRLVMEVLRRA